MSNTPTYTAESILAEWANDSEIDEIELGDAARNNPKLHSKYLSIYFAEKAKLLRLQDQYKRMKKIRFEYWDGRLSVEEIKQRGWEVQPLKILKAEIPMYLDGDEVLGDLSLKVGIQSEKVNVLEMILKQVTNRGFSIKSAIDWEKFRSGG